MVDEALNVLEWVARDAYRYEHTTCAFGMSLLNPCAFNVGGIIL